MNGRPSRPVTPLEALRALGYSHVPKASVRLRGRSQSLPQVLTQSPQLSGLVAQVREGQERLRCIQALLPAGLRAQVVSGGFENGQWCLMVPHNAAAAKVRQLLPAFCAHLRTHGHKVSTITLKVRRNAP